MRDSNKTVEGGIDIKADLTRRMIELLFSGVGVTEEERDGICRYLSSEEHSDYNEEALFLYFTMRGGGSRAGTGGGKSVFADELWPGIAEALGMDPDLGRYRVSDSSRAASGTPLVAATSADTRTAEIAASAADARTAAVVSGVSVKPEYRVDGLSPDLEHSASRPSPAVEHFAARLSRQPNYSASSGPPRNLSHPAFSGLPTASAGRLRHPSEEVGVHAVNRGAGLSAWRTVGVRVAAVLVPVALVVGSYFAFERDGATRRSEKGVAPAFVATTTVETPSDGIRTVTLGDGTEVTLNRSSTFSYNDDREGELTGEAYFRVAKDPDKKPFVIHSGHLRVTVLGTEFNFDTRTEEGASKVSLYEGRVRLEHSAGRHDLEEGGREFTFDHATAKTDIHDFDPALKPTWLEEERQSLPEIISLSEVFGLIERRYGVAILNTEAVDTSRRFNFMLDGGATIDDVMQALRFASGDEFDYTMDGKTVTLEKK
jgi:hypothetical protein